jgi:hypothetical protein
MRLFRANTALAAVLLLIIACDTGSEDGGSGSSDGDDNGDGTNDPSARIPEFTLDIPTRGTIGEPVSLTAAFAEETDGLSLTTDWRLAEHPEGSEARIEAPQSMSTAFTPDRAGVYIASFEVSIGDRSAQTKRTIEVEAQAAVDQRLEMSSLGPDEVVEVGESVTVAWLGADGAPITSLPADLRLDWAFCHRPTGSNIAPLNASDSSGRVRFAPDSPGRYCIEASVSRDGGDEAPRVLEVARMRTERVAVDDPAFLGANGIPMPGRADAPFAETAFDWDLQPDYSAERISEEAVGEGVSRRVLRTEIVLEFAPERTVETVNRVLEEIEGGIVSMIGNTDSVIVRIPDPENLEALVTLLESLEADPAVVAADESVLARRPPALTEDPDEVAGSDVTAQALPNDIDRGDSTQMDRVDHHLAVRGHSAWNMEVGLPDRLSDRPWIIVTDFFGDGPPNDDYAAVTQSGDFRTFSPKPNREDCGWREPCRHGYHVLGIILGDHDAEAGARGDVTGMYPQSLRVRVYDASGIHSMPRIKRKIIQRAKDIRRADGDANIVVNTSIGLTNPKQRKVNRQARRYIRAIRNNNLEPHLVHAVSAGNAANDGTTWPATRNNGFTYAALGSVTKVFGNSITNLDNILVVENRRRWRENVSANRRAVPRCLNDGSLRPGNISAIGSSVFSFGRENAQRSDGQGTSSIGGTSMASPQSAGLAALVWGLNPGLSGPQVVSRLIDSTRDDYPQNGMNCHPQNAQPVIDALDAMRGADRTAAARALMDVADSRGNPGADGRFDAEDINDLLGSRGGSAPFDYAPRDLNGDGITDLGTASGNTEPVDLDGDGTRTAQSASLLGYDAPFDESSVTDLDVLCYDAFVGTAYQGSSSARNRALGEACGIVDVEITDPAPGTRVAEGTRVEIDARITVNGGNGGDVTLRTGGQVVDTYNGFQPGFDPELSLATERVCPGDPTVTVRFDDSQNGLRASDSLNLTIGPAPIEADIAGSDPRWVIVQRTGNGIRLSPITLNGRGVEPSCTDPASEHVDPDAQLSWHNRGNRFATGAQVTLDAPFFDNGGGRFGNRLVTLEYDSRDGGVKTDSTSLRVCSADTAQGSRVPGYPECPDSVVLGHLVESLENTFGTIDPSEIEAELGRILYADDLIQAAGRLDIPEGPCDPRFCDPMNPAFPEAAERLRERLIEAERDPRVVDALLSGDGVIGALEGSDVAEAERQLINVAEGFQALEGVSETDQALFDTVYSLALGALGQFGPAESGYGNAWSAVLNPEAMAAFDENGGDRVAPARGAALGYLTAVEQTDVREGYQENPLARDGGTIGALFGAAGELVEVRERLDGETF